MTGRIILAVFFAALAAVIIVLAFTSGHKAGRRSRRGDQAAGYREGVKAEAARWEAAAGVPFSRLQAWRTARPEDPGPDDRWPDGIAAAGERREPPSFAEVMADAADTMLGLPPRVPDAPPVVAEVTDARPSGFVRHEGDVRPELLDAFRRALAGDVPTVTGVVVRPSPAGPGPDPAADWDLLAGTALPDYAAAALGGHRTVGECVDSIVMRAVGRS